ncbi:MAG TPA: LptA/OstA family protein [Methylomirabilota bacterium]|nr:LptA/OstA family protein [Methylomirabilota bacterium]
MKSFLPLALIAALWCTLALPPSHAQPAARPPTMEMTGTNSINIAATNMVSFETNGGVRVIIFWEGVVVLDPPAHPGELGSVLYCDRLTVRVPPSGGKIEDIQAEGNVIITQGANRASGSRALYRSETDVVELTGNPVLSTAEGTMRATVVELDRVHRRLRARGGPIIMEIKADKVGSTNRVFFPLPDGGVKK